MCRLTPPLLLQMSDTQCRRCCRDVWSKLAAALKTIFPIICAAVAICSMGCLTFYAIGFLLDTYTVDCCTGSKMSLCECHFLVGFLLVVAIFYRWAFYYVTLHEFKIRSRSIYVPLNLVLFALVRQIPVFPLSPEKPWWLAFFLHDLMTGAISIVVMVCAHEFYEYWQSFADKMQRPTLLNGEMTRESAI